MKNETNNSQTPPDDREGFAFEAMECELADAFAKALRDDQMDILLAQIDQSVQTLKAASETPEERVIRLCGELIAACRAEPS